MSISCDLTGYDQGERTTLFNTLKAVDWDLDKYIKSVIICLISLLFSNSLNNAWINSSVLLLINANLSIV